MGPLMQTNVSFVCHYLFDQFLTRTYAVSILVEGQGAVPGVQVHPYDGALAEARGELHFVPFVLQMT